MPEIDREILDRALRWCAGSGRPVREDAVRAALEPLGWDELLAVKATLADPPPRRNLGPDDLLALARGGVPPALAPARKPAPRRVRPPRPADAPRIRRARDRVEPAAPGPAALPSIDLLFRESGRAVLDRLVRRRGANRAAIVAALAEGWSAGDRAPGAEDLDRLLDHHGLSRGFEERERALVLHAYRKRGGVVARVARDLATGPEQVRDAVARLGLERQVETIRAERRRALESQATLSERARLLDEQEEALGDLGILPRLEDDLRRRLPGHLRALSQGGRRPTAADLGRSLSLSRPAVDRLAARLALDLRPSAPERPTRDARGPRRTGRPAAPAGTGRRSTGRPPPPKGRRTP